MTDFLWLYAESDWIYEQSLPVFARRDRWMTWRRRDTTPAAAKPPDVAS